MMTIKIKQLPEGERPYEKLEIYGEKMLSNAELLAIIIKSGTKENTSVELAHKVLSLQENINTDCKEKKDGYIQNNNNLLQSLQNVSIEEFQKIKGIGKVKAIQLKAVCELARRMSQPINRKNIKISSSKDVADLLMEELRFERVEYVKLLLLNSKNIIMKIIDVSKGGTNSAIVEPKEILQETVKIGCSKIILVHNHPSGDSTPSRADIDMTKRLYSASDILGIQLLDHIVIGNGCYTSIFSEERIVNN
ncbi:MAG: JAB domain-containing protein [Clostridiales bacterium]|nr:JAB domain-containing protein [Clostridiales bacterium]